MQGINTRTSNNTAATSLSAVNAEASKMLEAALEQMDGIISGSSGGVGGAPTIATTNTTKAAADGVTAASNVDPKGDRALTQASSGSSPNTMVMHERSVISAANVLSTAKTLALALEQVGPSAPTPDFSTAAIIGNWLDGCLPRRDADERLRSVQHEKDVLARQYQQLSERVSGQTERIGELEKLLTQKIQELSYKDDKLQRQTMLCSSLDTKNLELLTALSELKLQKAALELENADLRSIETRLENISLAVAAEQQQHGGSQAASNSLSGGRRLPFGSVGNLNQVGANASFDGGRAPKTPPALLRHQIHPQFHSLPRSHAAKHGHNNNNNNNNFNTNNKNSQANNNNNNNQRSSDESSGSGGGGGGGGGGGSGGLGNTLKAQRNVAFASNEKIIDDSRSPHCGGAGDFPTSMNGSFISQQNSTPSPTLKERSAKGFLQIFGKLRRSNSGNLELPSLEQAEPEFRRGGIGRATAAGRIEWSPAPSLPMKKAYSDWTPQEVCNWLNDLGLAIYEEDCRKWLRANPHVCFFTASPVDIEKELNIKFALHRKKIYLACDELTGREHDELALKAAELNTSWVMRWLDDIGLPQYKDTFQKAKVDGRILHRLTMEDLSLLNVTSCLHVASLRSGIQCMREMSWNPDCLIRRSCSGSDRAAKSYQVDESSPEATGGRDDSVVSASEPTENIALWTAHRVMEWLRVVDLSEYAPNLRGAGVHGALMRYENRFNAALLADLLSIPQQKTLLRRHLATHFKELVGSHVIQMKRDAENQFGYHPLTIASKVKAPKKTQFSLKRRRSTKGSADSDWTDYVCPMSMSMCLGQVFPSSQMSASTTATNASSTTTMSSSSPTPTPAVQPSNGGGGGGGTLSLSMVSESGESKPTSESPKQQQQTTTESTSPKPAVNFQYTPK